MPISVLAIGLNLSKNLVGNWEFFSLIKTSKSTSTFLSLIVFIFIITDYFYFITDYSLFLTCKVDLLFVKIPENVSDGEKKTVSTSLI